MELTPKQEAMFEQFCSRHVLNRQTEWDISLFRGGAARNIFFEQPQITQTEFDKEIVARTAEMMALDKQFKKRFRGLGEKSSSFTYKFFDQSGIAERGLSFREQVRAYRLNMLFLPFWLKARSAPLGKFLPYRFPNDPENEAPKAHDKLGKYVLSHNTIVHDEMPLALCLSKQDGQIMATIGGYLYFDGNRPAICITNVQGTKPEMKDGEELKAFERRTKLHGEEYPKINTFLKENWRVWFVREVTKIGKSKGLVITGRIDLSPHGKSKREYKRLQRQYRQTFRKAGFKEEAPFKFKLAGRAVKNPKLRILH
ncbi:MAG: hypothetical protein NTY48_07480 [Candidatus Diapherotrites archaeon]|nr:hypothetical protein [Candidatus Diapherotrites archaeon]